MKKKSYISPEMEITEFETEDVIAASEKNRDYETEIVQG